MNVLIKRTYVATDGTGKISITKVSCDPANFERHRSAFRSKLRESKIDLPSIEYGSHTNLYSCFSSNEEWLKFFRYLMDKSIRVEVLISASLGGRNPSLMDRNDSLTDVDDSLSALIETLSERNAFNIELSDSAGSMTFCDV